MKILIIGAEGQLGSEIKKFSVKFKEISWVFSTIKTLDLTKEDSIFPFLNKINPSHIINCAAYTDVDKAEKEFDIANMINNIAINIISKWTSINNKKLIHISTDYVFDGSSRVPMNENSLTNPINVYGMTKLNGENACLSNDSNSIVIRTSWLYSSFGKNFLKTMMELMKINKSINVVNDQIGSPTYAYDLVEVIFKIIHDSNPKSGLFHYSNEGAVSWFDFASLIKDIFNFECKIIAVSSNILQKKAKRPLYSLLDTSKIKKTYGVSIPYFRHSLHSCIQSMER